MTRSCADVRKTHFDEENADVALVIVDAETLLDDALQVDATPTHDAIAGKFGPRFHDGGELGFLLSRQAPRRASAMPIQKAIWTVSLRRGPPRLLLRGSYKCPLVLEVDIIAHVDRRTRSYKSVQAQTPVLDARGEASHC